MTEDRNKDNDEYPTKKVLAYSLGNLGDTIATQFFQFLIFIFYYIVVGLNLLYLGVGFIIWTIWNAINDPLLGALSDRTKTKWGKRKPWIIIGIIPTAILLVVVWMPPLGSQEAIFIHFLTTVMLFDTFYTMYSLNQVSLFPEMFQDLQQRAKSNTIIQFIGVFGLIIITLLPSFFIPVYRDPNYFMNYRYAGLFIAILFVIIAGLFVKFGIEEREEFSKDSESSPGFFTSLKFSMKNKSFRQYVVANFAVFYVFGMLPIISPLYLSFVLGIDSSLMQSLLLGVAILSAGGFMLFWRFISVKYGVKIGHISAMTAFILTLLPFMFITEIIGAFFAYFFVGIGLAGALFFRAVTISSVIDEDELVTGVRREGGYYGINALIIRLSTIAIIVTIGLVFGSMELAVFDPSQMTGLNLLTLRTLMIIYPTIALGIGILSMSRFPINKARYEEIKKELIEIHKKKKEQIES